jgi:general secretion pathway protein E
MGVEPSTFLEALNGVVSQRLVRRICSYCDSSSISGDEIDAQLSTADLQNAVQPGNGCDKCRGTGFYGRIGLAEVLRLDAPLKTALMERSPEKRMRALAASSGYQSIRDAGLTAVRKRLTTLQEVQRAVAFD